MSAIGAVVSHLKDDFALSQRVGSRIYRSAAKRNAPLPYIIVQRIGSDHVRHMGAAAGLASQTVQVTCWADNPDVADALAEDVRDSLDHRNHEDIGTQPNVVALKAAFLDSEIDTLLPADPVGESIFGVIMTWTIWHAESVPTLS